MNKIKYKHHSHLSQTQSPADSSTSHLLHLPPQSLQPALLPHDVTCVNLLGPKHTTSLSAVCCHLGTDYQICVPS